MIAVRTNERLFYTCVYRSSRDFELCSIQRDVQDKTTGKITHQPVEDILRPHLIPAIIGRQAINDDERQLFSLPARMGGLSIDILPNIAESLNTTSKITQTLTQALIRRTGNSQLEILTEQEQHAKRTKAENQRIKKRQAEDIRAKATTPLKRAMLLSDEKGASTWLTTLPIEEHGFALHKAAFRDGLALRYGWRPKGMPITCACEKSNTVDHALSCPKGGLVITGHNEVRDL